MAVTNTLAYYNTAAMTPIKSFIVQGGYSQYFIFFLTDEQPLYVRVFSTCKPFQRSVMKQSSLLGQFISYEKNGVLWIRYPQAPGERIIEKIFSAFFSFSLPATGSSASSTTATTPSPSGTNLIKPFALWHLSKLDRFLKTFFAVALLRLEA